MRAVILFTVNGCPTEFEIIMATFEEAEFRQYHRRMELFALMYIDGASRIESDDPKWLCFQV